MISHGSGVAERLWRLPSLREGCRRPGFDSPTQRFFMTPSTTAVIGPTGWKFSLQSIRRSFDEHHQCCHGQPPNRMATPLEVREWNNMAVDCPNYCTWTLSTRFFVANFPFNCLTHGSSLNCLRVFQSYDQWFCCVSVCVVEVVHSLIFLYICKRLAWPTD